MPQTPEQKRATEALREAIVECARLHTTDPNPGLITDWVVVAAEDKFNDAGERETAYNLLMANGELPNHVAHGLLNVGGSIVVGNGFRLQNDDEGD